MLRFFVLLVTVLCLLGCADRLVKQGDEYLERQEYHLAANHYEAALKADPDNDDLHRKFAFAKDQAVRQNVERARLATNDGSWEEAIEATRVALRWGADRSDATSWAATFDQKVAGEVYRLTVEDAFPGAIALAQLTIDTLPVEFVAKTTAERDNTEATWRGWLLSSAKEANMAGAAATEALYLVEAARVTRDADLRRRAVDAVEGVRTKHKFVFSVFAGANRGSAVLSHLPDRVGAAQVVRGRLAGASFTMEVQLRGLEVTTSTSSEDYVKDYVSGYNEYPNPRWQELERIVRQRQAEYDQAELDAKDAYRVYQLNPTQENYAVYESYYDRQNKMQSRLRDAEHQLRMTDETLREEVRATHRWTVHYATRTGVADVYMRWVDPITGKTATAVEPIRLSQSDGAQDGFAPAGVAYDPLEIDSVATFEAALAVEASKHVTNMLEQNYESHVSEALAMAEQRHGATEAAALGVILNPDAPPAGALERATRLTGVQPAVVKYIEEP